MKTPLSPSATRAPVIWLKNAGAPIFWWLLSANPALIGAEHIKPGAVVIDVGMNRLTDAAQVESLFAHDHARLGSFYKTGSVLVGDVAPLAMQTLSSFYTPVPGGVGPLTIAMLMQNTVELAERHQS